MLCWLGISTMSFQVSFFIRENMLLNVCGWLCECMCAYFFLPLVFRPVWHRAALLFPTAALLLAEADTSTLTDSRSRYGWLFTADINIHLVLFDQKFTESNIGVNTKQGLHCINFVNSPTCKCRPWESCGKQRGEAGRYGVWWPFAGPQGMQWFPQQQTMQAQGETREDGERERAGGPAQNAWRDSTGGDTVCPRW